MVDLRGQYKKIKKEIDNALLECVDSTKFIKGPQVALFEQNLCKYLNVKYAIGCGNGTDALQIALMALELKAGDEVIVPAFTYVATIEAIALLGLKPIMVDVDIDSFNISICEIKKAISPKTKVIVPVHLYGQSANMESIMKIANEYNLVVIEDNAQALGAKTIFSDGSIRKTGSIGHIACNSFFPTKNLGCFGDGGAITTNDDIFAEKCRMIAAHGQKKKYQHSVIGCNSRLDTIQAAVLDIKLKYLDQHLTDRKKAADYYFSKLSNVDGITLPKQMEYAKHSFNQFTIKVDYGKRDDLQEYLKSHGIPSIIYYPLPLYKQEAFKGYWNIEDELSFTEELCNSVLSIPMHTELTQQIQDTIIQTIKKFFL